MRRTRYISNKSADYQETTIEEDGLRAETLWYEWANHHDLKFHKNDQSPETFPQAFRGEFKRTDYELRLPDLGIIAVDVKTLKFHEDFENFILDQEEIRKQKAFQEAFHSDVWFAIIPRSGMQYRTFYWISLNKILKTIPPKRSGVSGKLFYPIPLESLVVIGWNDGLEKLFSSN